MVGRIWWYGTWDFGPIQSTFENWWLHTGKRVKEKALNRKRMNEWERRKSKDPRACEWAQSYESSEIYAQCFHSIKNWFFNEDDRRPERGRWKEIQWQRNTMLHCTMTRALKIVYFLYSATTQTTFRIEEEKNEALYQSPAVVFRVKVICKTQSSKVRQRLERTKSWRK